VTGLASPVAFQSGPNVDVNHILMDSIKLNVSGDDLYRAAQAEMTVMSEAEIRAGVEGGPRFPPQGQLSLPGGRIRQARGPLRASGGAGSGVTSTVSSFARSGRFITGSRLSCSRTPTVANSGRTFSAPLITKPELCSSAIWARRSSIPTRSFTAKTMSTWLAPHRFQAWAQRILRSQRSRGRGKWT
jgi:hypothetical protein